VTQSVDRDESIAAEYYDAARHPTSANFREASRHVLDEYLPRLIRPTSHVVEVGCGDSLVMAVLTATGVAAESVTLTDSSRTMLRYSDRWRRPGVELLVASAEDMPVGDGSFDLVVSILGDPYNTPRFWAEARRILKSGGLLLYTTPSHEWSLAFRGNSRQAVFDQCNGKNVVLRSIVLAPAAQRRMIEDAGLSPLLEVNVSLDDLVGPVSPKLNVLPSRGSSVVTAYFVRR
jgi:ubiquinone/menaquinone biosynthesis C-methylase UbiE